MRTSLGVLAVAVVGVMAAAQEKARTPAELANLPPYERLLQGDDAKKAAELMESYDKAMANEGWDEATKQARALLDFRREKQGADHYQVTDARRLLQHVEIERQLTPEGRKELATANRQNEELVQLYQQGQFAKSAQLGEQVLAIHRKFLGEKHPDYATSLLNLAEMYRAMGANDKAEPLAVQAHNLTKKLLGENHPLYATSLNTLAVLYQVMGASEKAEPLFVQARGLFKKLLGESHPDYATSLINLAVLYQSMGEYAKAEPLAVQARDLCKKLLGESHPLYATSLNTLATLYESMGASEKAERLYVQARDLFKQVLGESHPDYATSLNNLALLHQSMGEYAKAEPLYVQARDLYKQVLGENHPSYATSLNNLALLYQSMGASEKAERLYMQARDLDKKLLGENHSSYATSLNNLAGLYRSLGEYTRAEPLYVQARDLRKKVLGENHPDYAQSLNNLAVLYHSMRESPKAEPLLVECTRSYEMSRIARASGFGRAIGGEDGNPYFFLAAVSARLKKPQQGFMALERNLSRAFLDVQAARRGRGLTPDQQARQARLQSALNPLEQRIAVLVNRPKPTDAEMKELTEKIEARRKLNIELADLATELSTQEVSDFASIQKAIPPGHALLTWIDVAGGQGKGETQEHWACVLTSSGEPLWVPLPGTGEKGQWAKDDTALPGKLRAALALSVPPSNLPELTAALRKQRIEPILEHLKKSGVTQLYVVGVKEMAGLPVEVLAPEFTVSYVSSGTLLARLPKKPKYENTLLAVGDPIYEVKKTKPKELTALPPHGLLVDALAPDGKAADLGLKPGQVLLQYDDAKLTSVDDLKAAVEKAAGAGAKTANVTVWSVDDADKTAERVVKFPVGPLGVILAPDAAPLAVGNRRKDEAFFATLRGGEDWKDLPGTRYEVSRLRDLFPTATVLFDEKASEAGVEALRKSGDLGKFRYLHFATHGKGNSIAAFESKLILSQDRPAGEVRAGEPWMNNEISAREVLDFWKLNADLVTLSACQTGLGEQGGGDGLLGFAQAFLLSGSRSVCLSLWEVDDIATALLMQRFYQNLLGKRDGLTAPLPKAKALAEAKEWLRNLTAKEATALTAKLTGGVARGRGEKAFQPPKPATAAETAAGDDYKPYARPHYWSAFILLGDPD